jgi:hypothetical protein
VVNYEIYLPSMHIKIISQKCFTRFLGVDGGGKIKHFCAVYCIFVQFTIDRTSYLFLSLFVLRLDYSSNRFSNTFLKGTVQRKLTGVLSSINQQLMISQSVAWYFPRFLA